MQHIQARVTGYCEIGRPMSSSTTVGQSLMMRKDDVTRSKQETIATQITLPNHTARYTNLRHLFFFAFCAVCVCVCLSAARLVLISVLVLGQVVPSFSIFDFWLEQ